MNHESLEELANSIRKVGLLQPILVRISGDIYEVEAGHRRLQAAKMINMQEIEAIVLQENENKGLHIERAHENL